MNGSTINHGEISSMNSFNSINNDALWQSLLFMSALRDMNADIILFRLIWFEKNVRILT